MKKLLLGTIVTTILLFPVTAFATGYGSGPHSYQPVTPVQMEEQK